jgi:hypothetical protein
VAKEQRIEIKMNESQKVFQPTFSKEIDVTGLSKSQRSSTARWWVVEDRP